MSLSYKLKALRAKYNMTQQMLADRMNVARTTITGYETKNRQPSHEKLNDMADIFGVTVDYLIDDRETDESASSPLCLQSEPHGDQLAFRLYKGLSQRSKDEVFRYMKLLELWERVNKESQK